MQGRVGSAESETTYFPNANHSGECGNMKLTRNFAVSRRLARNSQWRAGGAHDTELDARYACVQVVQGGVVDFRLTIVPFLKRRQAS